jgi:protein gp37
LIELIEKTPHLDWLLLTKRIGNVESMIPEATDLINYGEGWQSMWGQGEWPENVWLGATICNQEEADRDIPKLLAVPAAKRFLSIEPMLGAIDLTVYQDWLGRSQGGMWCPDCPERGVGIDPAEHHDCPGEVVDTAPYAGIDWIICGGESGPGARPMHPSWAQSLRDQCAAAKVQFLFKQWGEWVPGVLIGNDYISQASDVSPVALRCGKYKMLAFDGYAETIIWKVGKKAAGRLLDGVTHNEVPNGRK